MKSTALARYTDKVRLAVLHVASLRKTKNMQGFLSIYEGMRVLLYSKDCVRFGLMNGCVCTVLQIVPAAEQANIPGVVCAGEPSWLSHVPIPLLLRAVDARW